LPQPCIQICLLRSAAIVAAYLMKKNGRSAAKGIGMLKEKRDRVGWMLLSFKDQLEVWERCGCYLSEEKKARIMNKKGGDTSRVVMVSRVPKAEYTRWLESKGCPRRSAAAPFPDRDYHCRWLTSLPRVPGCMYATPGISPGFNVANASHLSEMAELILQCYDSAFCRQQGRVS